MNRKPAEIKTEWVTIPGTNVKMERLVDFSHPLIPQIDPAYQFRKNLVEEVAYASATGENALLVGDAGCGKTSLIEQLAAFLNRPLTRINVHGESDTAVLIGRDMPTEVNGARSLVYRWGPLPKAMVEPYHWFLLDEIDAALQPVLFVLQQMLEANGRLVLEDAASTIVQKAKGFCFFATANTIGIAGRHKLLYSGTNRMNEATLDRFGCVIHVPEMGRVMESEVIAKHAPKLDPDFIAAIVRIAKEVRDQLQDEAMTCTFSTRRCIQWAQAMQRFHPLRAAQLTVLNKLSAEDAKVLGGVVQRYFGDLPQNNS